MAEYDKTVDEKLFTKKVINGTEHLTVSIYSYNKGVKKIQITRENDRDNKGKLQFAKLGRLTKEEALAILPILIEATKIM